MHTTQKLEFPKNFYYAFHIDNKTSKYYKKFEDLGLGSKPADGPK